MKNEYYKKYIGYKYPHSMCGQINDGFGCPIPYEYETAEWRDINCKECVKDLLEEIREYLKNNEN